MWRSEFGGVWMLASAHALHQPTIMVSEYFIQSLELRVGEVQVWVILDRVEHRVGVKLRVPE